MDDGWMQQQPAAASSQQPAAFLTRSLTRSIAHSLIARSLTRSLLRVFFSPSPERPLSLRLENHFPGEGVCPPEPAIVVIVA